MPFRTDPSPPVKLCGIAQTKLRTKLVSDYQLEDIAVLVTPLEQILESSKDDSAHNYLGEKILHQLEKDEVVYSLYQVFDALLGEAEPPEGGHTGIQEAWIAELLEQVYQSICWEINEPDFGDFSRKAAWQSIQKLLLPKVDPEAPMPWMLDDVSIDLKASKPYLSESLTPEVWNDLLLGDGGLRDEFLWDTDWRMSEILDLPPAAASELSGKMGLDLKVVHSLAHTPSKAEAKMAEYFLRYILWRDEVTSSSHQTS